MSDLIVGFKIQQDQPLLFHRGGIYSITAANQKIILPLVNTPISFLVADNIHYFAVSFWL